MIFSFDAYERKNKNDIDKSYTVARGMVLRGINLTELILGLICSRKKGVVLLEINLTELILGLICSKKKKLNVKSFKLSSIKNKHGSWFIKRRIYQGTVTLGLRLDQEQNKTSKHQEIRWLYGS